MLSGREAASFDAIKTLTADNAAQQARLEKLKPLVEGKFAELAQTIDLRKADEGGRPTRGTTPAGRW